MSGRPLQQALAGILEPGGLGGQGDLGPQFWQISLNKEVVDYAITVGPPPPHVFSDLPTVLPY